MELLGVTLGILILVGIIGGPIAALVMSSRARRRVGELELELAKRERELRWLYDKHKELEQRVAAVEARPAPRVAAPRSASDAALAGAQAVTPTPGERVAPGMGSHSDPSRTVALSSTPDAPTAHAPDLAADLALAADASEDATIQPGTAAARAAAATGASPTPQAAHAADAADAAAAASPAAASPPRDPDRTLPPGAPRAPAAPSEPPLPFEQRLAAWLTRIGAGVALLGVLYFFKYAVDTNLIGPTGRVLVGVVAGLALLIAAEVLRKTTQAAFLQILVGLGLALLFAAGWAGSVLYALIPITAGFAGNAVVLLIGAALAWHHRGQAILVLSLVAVFLNPVLLSTGQDRPVALFGYLLVFTGVMLAVAVRLRFAVAIAVAVLGVTAIFGGWYERYFDIHDFTSLDVDQPTEQLRGAYLALSARLIPLTFVGLFAGEWLAAAFALQKSGASERWTVPLALAALLLAHAGCAVLLPDQALWLGVAMIGVGALAIGSMHALGRTDLLMVPMIAAFLILAVQLPDAPRHEDTLILALLGLWTAAYVLAFLRSAARAHQTLTPAAAIRGAVGLAVFALLAAFLLLPSERATALGLVTLVVTLGFVALAERAGLAGLAIVGAVGALLLLAAGADARDRSTSAVDWPLLGTFVAWSLLHAGGVMYGVARRRAVGWVDLATLSIASAGLLLLVIAGSPDDAPTLRALAAALAGALDLAAATYVARTRPELTAWVSILAAQALGLFAVAVGLGISGAAVTIAWAALAFIAALLWSSDRSPTWAVALVLLSGATMLRVLSLDIGEAERAMETFRWSDGRMGVYRLTPLFNARAVALLGTGVGLLASALTLARAHARRAWPAHRATAGVLAALGHLALIVLFVTELRAYFLELPEPPPMVLDSAEFSAFWETVDAAKSAQYSKVNMVSTVTLAAAAMVLLAIGFAFKDAFHRYLGLAVFAGTLGKLIGWDVWNLARTYQIVVLTVVGALLLGSGFLYARLKSLFTSGRAAALLLALLPATLAARTARAEPPPQQLAVDTYTSRAPLEGIAAPGDYRAIIPVPLHAASAAATLFDDLRIAGPTGLPVPHIVRTVEPEDPQPSRDGVMYTPGALEGGGYAALFEVPPGPPHCKLELGVGGPTPYLRRVDVEAGETEGDLRVVASGGYVYAIDGEQGSVSRTLVHYPRSIARWVRVTLRPDREARDNTIRSARFIACEPEHGQPVRDRVDLTVVSTTRDAERRATLVDLDVGAEGLPLDRLVVEVDTAEFVRRVDVSASSFKNAWPYVTCGYLYRVTDALAPEDASVITLSTPLRKRWLRLTVHDGDDAPLTIRAVHAELPRRELVLRAAQAGAHRVYVGDKAGHAASYDLGEILARRTLDQPLLEARLGALEPNPELGKPKVPESLPLTEQHRGPIGIALGVALLGLSAWAVKLVRSHRPPNS